MGILESNPFLKGDSVKLNSKEEQAFFQRNNTLFKKYYINNAYNGKNLLMSLQIKPFIGGALNPDKRTVKDITWDQYLIEHINKLKNKYHSPWTNSLINILKGKNINVTDNKYFSDIFYKEFQIKTSPMIINSQNEKLNLDLNEHFDDLGISLFNTELSTVNESNYCKLDILDNLGGSFIEINLDELQHDDPNFQYYQRRLNVKKYIKILKEHIYNNKDNPINQIVSIFNNLFSKYIQDKIKEYQGQLEKQLIDQNRFNTLIKNFENEITCSLQEVICRMHSAVKLFYSTSVDYQYFLGEEKDDLINLITSFFFRVGNLYESIFDLYSLSFKDDYQNLQNKLIILKKLKPNKLGIEVKFCLDEEAINLRNEMINKKDSKNDNINNIENKNTNIEKKPKKTSLFQNLKDENKINNLFSIKEREEEKEENLNIIEENKIEKETGQLMIFIKDDIKTKKSKKNIIFEKDDHTPIRSKTKLSKFGKEDDYILEKLSFVEDSINDTYYKIQNQMRNSVNNFNNKTLCFPKLHIQLKEKLDLNNDNKESEYSKNKDKSLPYFSAINILKSIKKFKTPFEKILLMAAISDHIMENVNLFWKDMEQYIDKDFLFIESDEMMSIMLYIIIQTQMPEILIYCKMINNFTTDFTKAFNIAYNYATIQTSLEFINDLNDINKLTIKENGFIEASRNILNISNQRVSRLSIGSNQE